MEFSPLCHYDAVYVFLIFHFLLLTYSFTASTLINSFMSQNFNVSTIVVALIDAGLTNTIAFSFAVNGLVDIGVLKDGKKSTYMVNCRTRLDTIFSDMRNFVNI